MNSEKFELDGIDIEILSHLKKDGRKSFTDIADEMGVSVGTVRNRYNRMVAENVLHIIGWTDPVKAGFQVYSRVTIQVKPTELIQEVAQKITQIEEVSFVAITSGQYDLEINVMCRSNQELLNLMHQKIHKIEGVFETHTTVYFQVLKWASHNISVALNSRDKKKTSTTVKVK